MVKGMLSSQGKISADVRTNSLIIVDDDESLRKIRTFLENYDKPIQQVRIRVRFGETNSSGERSVSAGGSVSGKGWRVSTGRRKRDGVNIRVRDREDHRQGVSEYFINVASGSPAYIVTGKDIPYREIWIDLSRRYASVRETVFYERIETCMEVTPTIAGSHATLEITPRISRGGSDDVIRFARASTSLVVPLGRWIDIGGTNDSRHEVMSAIFGGRSRDRESSLSISLMVEKY